MRLLRVGVFAYSAVMSRESFAPRIPAAALGLRLALLRLARS